MKYLLSCLLLALGALVALPASQAYAQGQAGTTLSASKTATGFWEHRVEYDWSIEKVANPTQLQFTDHETQNVNYTLTATRTEVSNTTVAGVSGEICVTNGGDRPTEGLTLVDQVEYKDGPGPFQPLPGVSQTITPAQLGPGESHCYPYSIDFTPVSGTQYRNTVKVTITNHSGQLGQPFGPEPKAGFSMPGSPVDVFEDETATLTDLLTCPTGFTCVPSATGPWSLNASQVITYSVAVTPTTAACGQTFQMPNVATLTEDDTQTVHTDSAVVNLMTMTCPVSTACTYTQGYWKNHASAWPVNSLNLGNRVYTKTELLSVFNRPVKGNGLISMSHQLIAAKLNVANGTAPAGIAATIGQADALIGTMVVPPVGANFLSTSITSGLNGQLDAFNNGLSGAPHCN
jgi:hypothetical protein